MRGVALITALTGLIFLRMYFKLSFMFLAHFNSRQKNNRLAQKPKGSKAHPEQKINELLKFECQTTVIMRTWHLNVNELTDLIMPLDQPHCAFIVICHTKITNYKDKNKNKNQTFNKNLPMRQRG